MNKRHAYDRLGNPWRKTHKANDGCALTGLPRYSHLQRLVRSGGHCMTYDANGNQLRGYNLMRNRARTLAWTAANRLRSITESAITLAFRYDADRNLVKKDVLNAGNSAWYVWYVDKLYEKRLSGTTATHIHYLEAGGEIVTAPVCSWRRMFSGRQVA